MFNEMTHQYGNGSVCVFDGLPMPLVSKLLVFNCNKMILDDAQKF